MLPPFDNVTSSINMELFRQWPGMILGREDQDVSTLDGLQAWANSRNDVACSVVRAFYDSGSPYVVATAGTSSI